MNDTADEFVDLYNKIHEALNRINGTANHVDFGVAIAAASAKSPAVSFNETYLRSAARLRNAIVHQPRQNGRVIADPRPEAIERLRSAFDEITEPPRLLPDFKVAVQMCDIRDPLRCVLATMRTCDFSQMPVYDDGRFAEVVTAQTVARWLAVEGPVVNIEQVAVGSILDEHTEDPDHYKFLGHDATVYDALAAFDEFAHRAKYLDAILVTKDSTHDKTPETILTPYDIARLRGRVMHH